MVIKMIVRNIGEYRHINVHTPKSKLIHGMRRDLNHGIGAPALHHLSKHFLSYERTKRGHFESIRNNLIHNSKIRGCDHSHFIPSLAQNVRNKMTRGGFSIRARDPDHCHFFRGKTV